LIAIAQALVRGYPRAWRERYADEVQALVEGGTVTLRDLADLARGCVVERAKALVEPGAHPTWTFWGLGTVATVLSVLPSLMLALAAMWLGMGLRQQLGAPPSPALIVSLGLFAAVVGADTWMRRMTTNVCSRIRLGVVVLFLLFLSTVYWMGPSFARMPHGDIMHWLLLFVWVTTMHRLLGSHWPWRPIFDALERYQAAVEAFQWARMEADRCRTITAAIPCAEVMAADTSLAQAERERDDALAQLNSHGYRARFRHGLDHGGRSA
jgi:hypothetical protein